MSDNSTSALIRHTDHIDAAAWRALVLNTLAFTVCFAVWMMNGVLMTFLVDNGVHDAVVLPDDGRQHGNEERRDDGECEEFREACRRPDSEPPGARGRQGEREQRAAG